MRHMLGVIVLFKALIDSCNIYFFDEKKDNLFVLLTPMKALNRKC